MDKVKDILSSIRDRFANPLIFSFACSWIVINWQIPVALLWYNSKDIEKTGSKTIFDFISQRLDATNGFWHPLFFALGYTILIPIIRNIIRAFYTWASKWGENWNLNILKGGKIPIEKYLNFRGDYDKRTKILQDVISKENEYTQQYESAKTELFKAKETLNTYSKELTDARNFEFQLNDTKILNGYWTNTYRDKGSPEAKGAEDILIQNGIYYLIGQFGDKREVFRITNFYFNNKNKEIFFIKERIGQVELFLPPTGYKFNYNILKVENDNLLTGIENGITQIQYLKKPDSINSKDVK